MAAINKPQVSKQRIHQVINLKQIFGRTPNELEKQTFYNKAVDTIVERTGKGRDRFGDKFARYSKEWAAKKGVTRGSVDLNYTGRMLSSFNDSISGNRLKIQMLPDQTLKAFNHITGDTVPKRDFFGINEQEADKIKKQVEKEVQSSPEETRTLNLADLRAAVEGVRLFQEKR